MTLAAAILISFLAVRGFRFDVTTDGFSLNDSESFSWLILMLFFIWVITISRKETDKRLKIYSLLFSIITALFFCLGISLEKKESLKWIWESRSRILNYLNLLFSHIVLYYCSSFLLFRFLRNAQIGDGTGIPGKFSVKKVLLIWALFLIAYIPWYLYCYPANMTYDSAAQVYDAIHTEKLSNHHSAFLDLLLRCILLPIEKFTGSLQIGIGVTSFLQMALMTLIFALCFERITHYIKNRLLCGLIFAWFALYPVHTLYSVTLWKDIPFSICFLGLLLCTDAASENEDKFFQRKTSLFWLTAAMVLLPLTRHNGILITIFLPLFFLLRFPAFKRQILAAAGITWGVLCVWNFLLSPLLNVEKVESGLILSLPQQQMARVISEHYEEIDRRDLELYDSWYDVPEVWREYNGTFADPVKVHFRMDQYCRDPKAFFSLWLKFIVKYPVTCLEAFLHNNYGYWFPETQYWTTFCGVVLGQPLGDIHSEPLYTASIIDKIYKWHAYHQDLKLPLLPLLTSRGACWWLWLFCGFWCLYQNRKKFILFLPGLLLWLSILPSPVYNEFRYVYGLFIGLPLLMAAALTSGSGK